MLATLQQRPIIILIIGLGLTLGVVAYTCRAALGYDRLNDQVRRNHEVKEELSAVLRLVVDVETGQRGYLITDDPVYLEPYQEAISQTDARVARLDGLTKTSAPQQHEDVRASAARKRGARPSATNHSIRQRRPRTGSRPGCDVRRFFAVPCYGPCLRPNRNLVGGQFPSPDPYNPLQVPARPVARLEAERAGGNQRTLARPL